MMSDEIKKLAKIWRNDDFPKHLEWIELINIRGWSGHRVDFKFPITAIVGENGAGKSTIIQAAASIYDSPNKYFASDFFPDTAWDRLTNCSIRASVKEGGKSNEVSVRKPGKRWRGNDGRRKRDVIYLDLRRTQPIYAKTGYRKIAKAKQEEGTAIHFERENLERFSRIVGKNYDNARQATALIDKNRHVPVVCDEGREYSGFHQGAGESTIADLVCMSLPKYSLVLIDEIETSLHPRAQRRLIRDLAKKARLDKIQFILTTHSPYILEELPNEARVYVFKGQNGKCAVPGVSPELALSKMDEENHPEIDVYVEDNEAKIILEEIISKRSPSILKRCSIQPFGAASVGKALGTMVKSQLFKRPTIVVLDGDQEPSQGCLILPGRDAPEKLVFKGLAPSRWAGVSELINRPHSELIESIEDVMTQPNHHEWIKNVADNVVVDNSSLWRNLCRKWLEIPGNADAGADIVEKIEASLC